MSHPDQLPTALELITADWLPRKTERDATVKADWRGSGMEVLRAPRRRPWPIASPQWHRLAGPGESHSQDCGRLPNSWKHRGPAMDKIGRLYATVQLDNELALVVFFSLTGLDLTLWLLAKGALAGTVGLFAALMPG